VISVKDLNRICIYGAPVCFVTNLNNHWIGIWVTNSLIEVYDGLGENSGLMKNESFVNFLCNNLINRNMKYTRQIQSLDSVLCGHLCVVCLTMRSANNSFDQINDVFSETFNNNDDLISNAFHQL